MNYVDPEGAYRLLTTLEAQWLAGKHAELVQGLEAGFVLGGVVLVGRVAYGTASLAPGVSKVSAGGGIELGRFHIDYAYRPLDSRGDARHRIGVRWTP